MDGNTLLVVLTSVLGLVATYLRFYTSNAINEAVRTITTDLDAKVQALENKLDTMREEMVPRELYDSMSDRLDRMESWMLRQR